MVSSHHELIVRSGVLSAPGAAAIALSGAYPSWRMPATASFRIL